MPAMSRAVLAAAAVATTVAIPAAALGSAYVLPSSGTQSGTGWSVAWTTVDTATCSVSSGTQSGTGCAAGAYASPQVAASAFGSVWLAGGGPSGTLTPSTSLQVVNPTTSAVTPPIVVNGTMNPTAAVLGGSYLWIAGQKTSSSYTTSVTRVVGVDSTGTVRKTFTSSVKANGAGARSIAYGAGAVWVGDSANRIYALSPSTGKLLRTISTSNTRGLAVGGGKLWGTDPRGRTVKVFNTSNGKLEATRSVAGSPNALVLSGSTMYAFSQQYLYAYSTKTLKQTGRWAAPLSGSGWVGAAVGPGGLWASNYVAQIVRFNTATKQFDVNARWSNDDTAGPLASAGGALWVPDTSASPFPSGHGVTRFTVTS